MIFDILCYGIAIATTLAFVGSARKSNPAPATREIDKEISAIATINAIAPLPEDCLTDDELLEEGCVEFIEDGTFTVTASVENAALVESAGEAIAQYWNETPTCNVVAFSRPRVAAKTMATEEIVATVPLKLAEYRTRDDLRGLCNSAGIQPLDRINGKRKFWNVAQMVKALGEAGYDVVKI